jgi:hypothetical protein
MKEILVMKFTFLLVSFKIYLDCHGGSIDFKVSGMRKFLGIVQDCGEYTGTCKCDCTNNNDLWLSEPRYAKSVNNCDPGGYRKNRIKQRCGWHCDEAKSSVRAGAKKYLHDQLEHLITKCKVEWDCDNTNYQQIYANHIKEY